VSGERARGFLVSGCAIVVVVFVEGRRGCESRGGETRGGVKSGMTTEVGKQPN